MSDGKKPLVRMADEENKLLSVSIWENTGSKGAYKTLTIQKAFKRKEEGSLWEHQTISGLNKANAELVLKILTQGIAKL